jgi:hypothetical protein
MSALGTLRLGSGALASTWLRVPPVVTITAPGSGITSPSVTATWSYSSAAGRAQALYLVQLRTSDGSTILYTSGVQSGTDVSHDLDFLLSSGQYQLWVSASDLSDWSEVAVQPFTVDLADVSDFPDEPLVGSVYEIAINGMGFMLADSPDPQRRYRRLTGVLDPPRFTTGDTPFSQAIERYTIIGATDWSGGAGQDTAHREDSDSTRYLESEGVNPFEDGLRLLPATELEETETYASGELVVTDDGVFYLDDTNDLKNIVSPGDAPTAFSIAAAGTISSLASDGVRWYAADGAAIFRGASAADPGAAWSTINAVLVSWALDRLVAVYVNGSSRTALTTLAEDGTEEVADGRFTFPSDTSIPAITAGDGFLWFATNRGVESHIRAWQLGSADEDFVALSLPAGQYVLGLGFYLGNLFLRAGELLADGTTRVIIYRCIPSEGRLTPQRVLDIDDAGTEPGGFTGSDRFVLFSWSEMADDGRSGIGCIDLSTGGWSRWLYAPVDTATGATGSIVLWEGRTAFMVSGYGLVVETTDPLTTGYLRTSHADLGSGLSKVVDDITVTFEPLPTGGEVSIDYDIGVTGYVSAGADAAVAGLKTSTWEIAQQGASIGAKITLTATDTTPVVQTLQKRVHPLSLADQVLTLPVNCGDQLTDVKGAPLPGSGPGKGMNRVRVLESLQSTRVRLQDVDWPFTGTATIWEVVGVEADVVGVYDRKLNHRVNSGVAVLTLRRGA